MSELSNRQRILAGHAYAFSLIHAGRIDDARRSLAGIKVDAPERKPMVLPSTECPHRGLVSIRIETADLCGYKGQQFDIFPCAKHGECSLHRYCQRQTIRSCVSCKFAGEDV